MVLIPKGSWGNGLVPTRVTAEVWLDAAAVGYDYEDMQLLLNHDEWRSFMHYGNTIGFDQQTDHWHELEIASAQLSGATEVKALGVGIGDNYTGTRLRNIRIET